MAWLLVRLKARLLVNAFSAGIQQVLGLVGSLVAGFMAAVFALGLLAGAAGWDGFGDLVVIVFAAVWVGWLVLPALTFSSDETLDPQRFALLPLRARQLVPGLLVAGLVGVGPIATFIGALGPGIGIAATRSFGPALVALIAAVLLVVTSVAWSRAVLTAFSNVLGSRRGRDIAAISVVLLVIVVYLGIQAIPPMMVEGSEVDLSAPAAIAAWTPGGMAGAAVRAAADGGYGIAFVALGGLVASTVVALMVWVAALKRSDRRVEVASSKERTSALYPRSLGWLPRGRTTAITVRFLRSLARDPRVRNQAFGQFFLVLPILVILVTSGLITSPAGTLAVAAVVVPVGLVATNQFGFDGPALWLHQVTGTEPTADLRGRNLAVLLVAVPLAVVAVVGVAFASGSFELVPVGLLLAVAGLGVTLGVANLSSVLLPIPIPERRSAFGSSTTGQGFVNSLLLVVAWGILGLLLLPLMIPPFFFHGTGARLLAAGGGVVYGAGLWWFGSWLTVARLNGRGPELLAAVTPDD